MAMNSATTRAQLLSDKSVAQLLECSRRKVWSMHATGSIPEPLRLGRSVRWRESDISLWLSLGCPSRERFEAERSAKS